MNNPFILGYSTRNQGRSMWAKQRLKSALAAWSEHSLSAWRNTASLAIQNVSREMPCVSNKDYIKLVCVFVQFEQSIRNRTKHLCILGYTKCALWRFWSDCANAQADLNLRWAHMSDGTFCGWYILSYVVWGYGKESYIEWGTRGWSYRF